MYIQRTLEAVIHSAKSNNFSVVMVSIARQVGKTTLRRHLAEESRR